jgi:hypothetical protein
MSVQFEPFIVPAWFVWLVAGVSFGLVVRLVLAAVHALEAKRDHYRALAARELTSRD